MPCFKNYNSVSAVLNFSFIRVRKVPLVTEVRKVPQVAPDHLAPLARLVQLVPRVLLAPQGLLARKVLTEMMDLQVCISRN